MKRFLVCAALLSAGCGAAATNQVRPDAGRAAPLAASTTLGRVVVYRNGVAYFERRAHVTGDTLVLSVPEAKLDDLLKSLSVVDLKTQEPVPVAYRTETSPGKEPVAVLTITLSGKAPHDLVLSYVAEAPAWKPSYRVAIGEDGEIDLQGWTVIDNTSGEDWVGVRIGVGSSSARSFRHDLRSVRQVARGELAPAAPFAGVPQESAPAAPVSAPAAQPSTDPIGEAHFESPVAMTVRRGTSAMIAILHERTQGELAYLYDSGATNADAQFPSRVVRLKNPTSSVLESGPVAFFGGGRFIGEGLPDAIAARAVAFIPYALDRQVVVERRPQAAHESIAKITYVEHGVVQAEMRHARTTQLVLRNRQSEPAVVYVRHVTPRGFRLVTPGAERIGEAQYVRVLVKANGQEELALEEEAPVPRALDLRAPGALEMVQAAIASLPENDPLRIRVAAVAAVQGRVRDGEARLTTLSREIAAYAERAAELRAQIAELRAARTGAQLQKELERSLADIERAQSKATAEAAAQKDALTVSRIAFQNSVAELTLGPAERVLARAN